MKATNPLTVSQLAQRLDELQDWADTMDTVPDVLTNRINELGRAIEKKQAENNFNKGIVTPLPPNHLDNDNPSVVTPKAPDQVEREYKDWERRLDR